MFFSRRRPRPAVRFLEWRIRFFAAGAILSFAGIYLEVSWLVTAGLVALIAGFALRFVPDRNAAHEEEEQEG